MNATAVQPAGAQVLSLMQHQLLHALEQRARYKYVKPHVLAHGEGFRIESPCCSRNVDPSGGVIDIALLLPPGAAAPDASPAHDTDGWNLFSRDHASRTWVWQDASPRLGTLLERLCVDAKRVFWP